MKILCNACGAAEATLMCSADEAALCRACDAAVHEANPLAEKHRRVPLLPAADEAPKCDICQEAPGYFFCLEDRALLCRDCDVAIHNANPYVAAHQRFLVTGVQVGLEPPESIASASCELVNAGVRSEGAELKLLPGSSTMLSRSEKSPNLQTSTQGDINGRYSWNNSSISATPAAGSATVKQQESSSISLSGRSSSMLLGETGARFPGQGTTAEGNGSGTPFFGDPATSGLMPWPANEYNEVLEFDYLSFVEHDSPKADSAKMGSSGGSPPILCSGEFNPSELLGEGPGSLWQVPELPSPPTASGLHWPSNLRDNSRVEFVPDVSSFGSTLWHDQPYGDYKRRRGQM